jgi:hypothetical protein
VTAVVVRAAIGGAVTYPGPEYTGGGEHSGTFRPAGGPRDLDHGHRSGAHHLATGATTDGRFGLYRWEMGPRPGGPAAHIHRAITESFYVHHDTFWL